MVGLAVWIELANVVPVQRPHDADARQHQPAATGLRILEGDELVTLGQRDRIVEWPAPALGCLTRRDQRPPA
jgi:hypothetical protein